DSAGVFTVTASHTFAGGLGRPEDFGNTFCGATPPSYHKPIIVTIGHESALTATATSDATITIKPGSAHLASDGSLIVVGTTGNDQFVVNPAPGNNPNAVTVLLNSVSLGTFTLGPGGRLVVASLAGDDDIQVAGGIGLDAVLYGGPGANRIKGGGGRNIEAGCDGSNTLTGGGR